VALSGQQVLKQGVSVSGRGGQWNEWSSLLFRASTSRKGCGVGVNYHPTLLWYVIAGGESCRVPGKSCFRPGVEEEKEQGGARDSTCRLSISGASTQPRNSTQPRSYCYPGPMGMLTSCGSVLVFFFRESLECKTYKPERKSQRQASLAPTRSVIHAMVIFRRSKPC
jgi:hypothetical protein